MSSIEASKKGKHCTIRLGHELTVNQTDEFRHILTKYHHLDEYTIDCDGLRRIDSAGIGVLVEMQDILGNYKKYSIMNTNRSIHDLLLKLHLEDLFTIGNPR